jgi:hypothetical protein
MAKNTNCLEERSVPGGCLIALILPALYVAGSIVLWVVECLSK